MLIIISLYANDHIIIVLIFLFLYTESVYHRFWFMILVLVGTYLEHSPIAAQLKNQEKEIVLQ